jgi:hypothetical protein
LRREAAAAVLLLLCCAALAAAGCGKSASTSPAELALEREDLVFVARALQSLESQANAEVAATKAAWPQIAYGLPTRNAGLSSPEIRAAIESAERLALPTLLEEQHAAALTGPGYEIAGLYRDYSGLAGRSWQMIAASIAQIEHGSPAAARFARANVALYIDGIYDAHFGLAQIGKQLLPAYKKLGGGEVFGAALTPSEVDGLAQDYSEANDRLEPHVTVKLGS